MRNLLFFGPFLWLRNLVWWIMLLLLTLLLLLFIVGNSSMIVKRAVDLFAPDYNISYESIGGNAFSGFKIINPKYNNQIIAKKIDLKWNPESLADKQIEISKIHLKDANINAIKALIASFSSDSNETIEDKSTTPFDFKVDISDIDISLVPFVQNGISITGASLRSSKINYENENVSIENIELNVTMGSEVYENIFVDSINVEMKNLSYDITTNKLNSGDVVLYVSSNLTNLDYKGVIKDSHLLGKVILYPKDNLYSIYKLPLRKEAISKINIDLDASEQYIIADIDTSAAQLLDAQKDAFNLDIKRLHSHVLYDINQTKVDVNTMVHIDTPYANNIDIVNNLRYLDEISYSGTITLPSVNGIDVKVTQLASALKLNYTGDTKSIATNFSTNALKGTFITSDFKHAKIHLETKETLLLSKFVSLPEELSDSRVDIMIDAPLNLSDFSKVDVDLKVKSNIVNVDGTFNYAKAMVFDGGIVIPEDSLLKGYNSDIKWSGLTPLQTVIKYENDKVSAKLKSKSLNSNILYDLKSTKVNGKINIAGISVDIEGMTRNRLNIYTNIKSIDSLGDKLNSLYEVDELPPLKGKIDATLVIDNLQSATLNLSAPKLVYRVDKQTTQIIKDLKLSATMDANKILLKSYQVTYDNQKYYSTKEAKITLDDDIVISNFWLNDELLLEGKYNKKEKKGNFQAKAKRFHVKTNIVDIYAKLDTAIYLEGENTDINGKVILLEGSITPQTSGQTFANDSDIVILQHLNKKEKSSFMDNLNLTLQIVTQKPLLLKQNQVKIRLKPELTINKQRKSDMMFLGDITLLKGGSYKLEDKKIILDKSHIYLTGKIDKPTLDIKAKYKSLNHLITIGVTGTPTKPRLDFSSSPTLTKEQILSVLLFDTEGGGDTHSGNEMMKMMGGAMAKAALSEVGVSVDHLVFGEGNSIEVGKKLTKKVTVIYINEEVPKVKLEYKHNKHTESVIGVSEESQSYDIIFKTDF